MTRLFAQYQPRITLVNGAITVMILSIVAKLFFIQVLGHEDYHLRADRQSTALETLPAIRGEILARGGESFTTNTIHYSFAVDPQVLEAADSLAYLFARVFNRPADRYLGLMRGDRSFAWLERNVPAWKSKPLLALDFPGLIVRPEVRRRYPFARLAAPVIGFTDVDNRGIAGIELEYETSLRGRDGRQVQRFNARGNPLYRHRPEWTPPMNGAHVRLTIDIDYQAIFEEELERAYERLDPTGLQGVLLDPHSGEILALAQFPSFDPNRAWESPIANQRLKPVNDMYEPGSTLKVITAVAALEEGLYGPDDLIDCENGEFLYGELLISDTHPRAELTLAGIMAHSSNIGIIKIAEQLGADRLYRYFTRFGLGARTGVGWQGETPGLLREPEAWSEISTGELAMGQEIGVTTLQLALIYAAIANGGLLLRPRLVHSVPEDAPTEPQQTQPQVIRRVASRQTMRRMREILYYSVEEGTGSTARIAGYQIAGKTGTGQKFIEGRYSDRKFMPTFAAMIPADNPRLVCVVAVDSPRYGSHFGSEAAAPIVRNVFQRILHLNNDFYAPPPAVADRQRPQPILLASAVARQKTSPRGQVPDFLGYSLRKALQLARQADVRVQLEGSGRVVAQSVPVGAPVNAATLCRLTLAQEGR